MSYRNKTYVILGYDEDNKYYNTMKMWKQHDHIDFNFYDAHDINNIRATSTEDTIKRRLRERMNTAKQVIVLVGEETKTKHRYVRWEIAIALKLDLPIIAVNLDGANRMTNKIPPILRDNGYFVTVPFNKNKIKHALDSFPSQYHREKHKGPDNLWYTWKSG